jgi:hypothetical protein
MRREYQDREDLSEEEQMAQAEGLSRIKIWGCYNITKSTYDECKNIPHTFYFKRLLTEQEEDNGEDLPEEFAQIPKEMFTGKMDCKMYFDIMDKTIQLYDLPLVPITSFMIKQHDIEKIAKKLDKTEVEQMAEYLSTMIENGVFDPSLYK